MRPVNTVLGSSSSVFSAGQLSMTGTTGALGLAPHVGTSCCLPFSLS
eukprot:CAMPEP_0185758218 /NCGR_PEP_ID=MMETSP1174-20130828/16802_1 /TAXON_ID=35687 /ORGANISM="Dictyocha speculum, Strain CCMP1381" /LENGTH=46 /DNA_ID= /DNA_START= /DNA_END= /DNA_ORIENTATION=